MSPSSSSVRTTISSRTWCPLWTVTFGKSGLPGTTLESFPPWTRFPRAKPPWTRSTVMGNILLVKSWSWRSLESRLLRAIHWWPIPTLLRETLFVRRKSSGGHYQWRIQDFPEEGAPTHRGGGAPTYDFAKFSQKLHEIEKSPGGARVRRPL